MATLCAYSYPEAWPLTRERIGHGLCECYPVAQDLPVRLLMLVEKLAARESSRQTLSPWFQKLDALEGNMLLRSFRKRLASSGA